VLRRIEPAAAGDAPAAREDPVRMTSVGSEGSVGLIGSGGPIGSTGSIGSAGSLVSIGSTVNVATIGWLDAVGPFLSISSWLDAVGPFLSISSRGRFGTVTSKPVLAPVLVAAVRRLAACCHQVRRSLRPR
jgi:hypothetical protein